LAAGLVALTMVAGCGSSGVHTAHTAGIPRRLLSEARPIGAGPRFQPPAKGPVVGPCRKSLGRRFGVHVEVFGADRVVIVPGGIGTLPPRAFAAGRISAARCYGSLVTLEPTGLVLVRPGPRLSLSELFRSWGVQLSTGRLASFRAPAGGHVAVFVGGRKWSGPPGSVPLTRHAEIVLEVGPHVPPHASYTFPAGT
jgi:hypothetical protein